MGRKLLSLVPALHGLAALEKRVAYGVVRGGYAPRDVALALWPAHIVRACEVAYEYVGAGIDTQVRLQTPFSPFWLRFTPSAVPMATPKSELIYRQWNAALRADIGAVLEVCERFETVRRAIRWLEKNTTARVALYYAPWLAALAPASFAGVEAKDGALCQPLSQVAQGLREAATTVATGILSPEIPEDLAPAVFQVAPSETNNSFPPSSSTMFRII